MSKDTCGPAFSQNGLDPWKRPVQMSSGMTLRDYFAAKAMPAVIANWMNTGDVLQDSEIPEVIARDCYILADAMLKAREA